MYFMDGVKLEEMIKDGCERSASSQSKGVAGVFC